MLYWSVVFFIVAIIASIFGFTGIASGAQSMSLFLFWVFIFVFLVTLILGLIRRRGPRP